MKAASVIFIIIIIIPMVYFASGFIEAKHICQQNVLDTQTAIYQDPGGTKKRNAAYNAALASPECTRISTFAKFVQLTLRGD